MWGEKESQRGGPTVPEVRKPQKITLTFVILQAETPALHSNLAQRYVVQYCITVSLIQM